jgi:alpha-glucosidase
MKYSSSIAFVILLIVSCSKNHNEPTALESPNRNIVVNVFLKDGAPAYKIVLADTVVLDTSRLGLSMNDNNFYSELELVSTSVAGKISETYTMLYGKRKDCRYEANERTWSFRNKNGQIMEVTFRVSDDGVAFRYSFPGKSEDVKFVNEELTSFKFTKGATAFLQPMSEAKSGWSKVNPCYEEFYEKEIPGGTSSPSPAGWVYPALFHSGRNWIVITEAGLDSTYCGTRLKQDAPLGEYTIGFPDNREVFPGGEVNPNSRLPWATPWRVLAIGNLQTIIESDLGTALASKPSSDSTFARPGQSAWSWALLKDDSTVFSVQKKFIDYAADMKWEYCLIDADWDRKIGYDKMRELVQYADTKSVGVILWYNSAGTWNETPYTPKSKLVTRELREKEFSLLHEMGVKGVKIDFFGGDGQSMIQYYIDIMNDAARYKLMVNFHGSTIPRGWHRTYPHLMSMEGVRGFEYVTFEQKNADEQPSHCAILPFTRNLFDPMDFTPLSLTTVPNIKRKTTAGFELALPVIFISGITHLVETPDGMKKMPSAVRELLKELPASWDETKFLSGYPGKEIVLARRSGSRWYLAGINGENMAKNLRLGLSAFAGMKGTLFTDDKTIQSFQITDINNVLSLQQIVVPANGGFVLQLH